MHSQESALENEIHKLHRYFEIQLDHLISTGQPDEVMINNNNKNGNLLNRVKLEKSEKNVKYLDLLRQVKKNYLRWKWQWYWLDCCALYSQQKINEKSERLGSLKRSGDNPNKRIIKIGQNIKERPGDWRNMLSLKL